MKFLLLLILLIRTTNLFSQEPVKEFYSSGELKAVGRVTNGLKEGEWSFYYPSGKKNSIENYKSGALHGDVLYFYPTEVTQARSSGTKEGCKTLPGTFMPMANFTGREFI